MQFFKFLVPDCFPQFGLSPFDLVPIIFLFIILGIYAIVKAKKEKVRYLFIIIFSFTIIFSLVHFVLDINACQEAIENVPQEQRAQAYATGLSVVLFNDIVMPLHFVILEIILFGIIQTAIYYRRNDLKSINKNYIHGGILLIVLLIGVDSFLYGVTMSLDTIANIPMAYRITEIMIGTTQSVYSIAITGFILLSYSLVLWIMKIKRSSLKVQEK